MLIHLLRKEIAELQHDLAVNSVNLRVTDHLTQQRAYQGLIENRHQIMLSILHRQGKMLGLMEEAMMQQTYRKAA
jgi:hypothetical protein